MQYGELVYACWYGRQVFTAIMVAITIAACLRTTLRTYANRRMLIRCSVPLAQPFVMLNCVHGLACLEEKQLMPVANSAVELVLHD